MAAFIIILLAIIICVNLVLNLTNLTRIVNYCFETGSLDQYWILFYKGCIHARAIYSSIFMIIIGVLIFIVIAPFILISGATRRKEIQDKIKDGLYFDYQDLDLQDKTFTFTNIQELGIEKFRIEAKGNIRIDCINTMIEIADQCEKIGLKIEQEVLQHYDLDNKKKVTVPMVVNVGEKVFPVYFIYNEFQKQAYHKINPALKANHFENAIYFSVINMEVDSLDFLKLQSATN